MFKSVTYFVVSILVLIGIAFLLVSPSLGQPAVDHFNVKGNGNLSFVSIGKGAERAQNSSRCADRKNGGDQIIPHNLESEVTE